MADAKWEKLPYLLKTPEGTRSLILLSNFEPFGDGWFDTGKYTIVENADTLGDLSVDLYTEDGMSWNGKPNEFTAEQLEQIVSYISFYGLDDHNDPLL